MPSDYTPQTWHDLPATDTPISAARLGVLETGLADHDHPGGGGGGGVSTRPARLPYRQADSQIFVPAGRENVQFELAEVQPPDVGVVTSFWYEDPAVPGVWQYFDQPQLIMQFDTGVADQTVRFGSGPDVSVDEEPDPATIFTATLEAFPDDTWFYKFATLSGAIPAPVPVSLWFPTTAQLTLDPAASPLLLDSDVGQSIPWSDVITYAKGVQAPFSMFDAYHARVDVDAMVWGYVNVAWLLPTVAPPDTALVNVTFLISPYDSSFVSQPAMALPLTIGPDEYSTSRLSLSFAFPLSAGTLFAVEVGALNIGTGNQLTVAAAEMALTAQPL